MPTDSTYDRTRRPRAVGEPLWTADEVAQFLNLPRARVYYWARKGVLPHFRIGRSLRFAPEHVRTLIGVN
jgi:excisionase family DNA binding protein